MQKTTCCLIQVVFDNRRLNTSTESIFILTDFTDKQYDIYIEKINNRDFTVPPIYETGWGYLFWF
ncbi:hypothetical protein CN980_28270 [Bacillus cereus]|uniref:Uncharacterized protein n=1 Tax=Bacillus cereus TaxID=1396 RepID=A0A9X7C6B8_BACCE|nr:hypothetical protein CN980_28270 [Bacillus cereus]